ncbi:hypothetical protein [Nocardia acidivorans]|nr:hypothetical protein [Nocardia acidivorans]
MFLATSGRLQAVQEGAVEVSDAEAVDALTLFIWRGLTGRDIE